MDGTVIIGTELNTKSFDAQIKQLESKLQMLEKSADETNIPEKFRRSADEARELNVEIEKTKNQLTGLYKKQAKINSQGFSNMQQSLNNIGNSITGITKKVVKWGLAIFSIRSIYTGIRQAVSQIMQEDENLKWQVDYMKFAIGQAIKPIVEFIVNLVYKILAGVGAIIKLIFGINIFSKVTVDNFKKANTNAKKLQKTLTGFDEMNILNEDGSVGIGNKINDALSNFGDLSTEVDRIGEKIKRWFYGGDYANIGDALIGNIRKLPNAFAETFGGLYNSIIGPYIVTPFLDGIDKVKEGLRPIWEPMRAKLIEIMNNIKPLWSAFIDNLRGIGEKLRPVWEPAWNSFKEFLKDMLRTFAPFLNKIIDGLNYAFGWAGLQLDHIEVDAGETGDAISTEIGGSLNEINQQNIDDKDFTVNINANTEGAEQTTKSWLDSLWEGIQNIGKAINNINFSELGNNIGNFFSDAGRKISKIFGFAKGGIIIPKLASGGIINQPGRGVPLGSAIGGERGQEGVIPLTDSQQMELLGEAIGRYISINATVPVYVGNRQIAREIRKIDAENDFAYNR